MIQSRLHDWKIMLENQVAVITGASSGIGKAIALSLANQSVRLGLIGRPSINAHC
ncbi:MAG: hypothetical protein IGS39_21070 [Calothrix sp. C42_A2020_038]|nr:hypothetical protein [Calothrix sp. C42_A2020_038]